MEQNRSFLQIRNLCKQFPDGVRAVDKLNLSVEKGDIFALLGSSGCGKSTLLRMLAGFEKATSGEILLDGHDITDVVPYQRPINMMFQSYALFPHFNVRDNIAFGLRRERLTSGEITKRTDEMLALVQLTDLAKRKPLQLSGGQQQRVALARSLAKRPRLLLLDEPLGSLDKKLREQTQFQLVNIIEEVGVTCVMVTHDQHEAMTMAYTIAVMDKGRVMQVGEPHEIYEAPCHRFVADFIGDINLIDGQIILENGNLMLKTSLGTFSLPPNKSQASVPSESSFLIGQQQTLAIRPEKLSIAHADTQPRLSSNLITGVVKEIAYLGAHNTYIVATPDGIEIKVVMINASRADRHITWDDQVDCWWDSRDSILLAPTS